MTLSKNHNSAFVTSGLDNLKNASRTFEVHHRSAISSIEIEVSNERSQHWSKTSKVVRCRTSWSKELPLQGFYLYWVPSWTGTTITWSRRKKGKSYQLLKVRVGDSDVLNRWLHQNKRSYASHEVQNEMLQIMAHEIQRSIVKDVWSILWYCVSADEKMDVSLTEQVN